jgi:putative membrane protein
MDIPVYLIAGFLDAGKTEFINGILRDGFAAEDRTLLLCCEEGENGYDPKVLGNVFTYTVEDEDQLTPDFLKKLEKQYRPKQVIVEYNGMWSMEKLYREGLPANWILYQIMCLVDATTFEMYLKNMGQLMMEKITNCDMLIFNRCNEQLRARLNAGAEVLDKAVARVENTGKIKPFGNVIVAGTAGQKERHAGKSPFY